MCSVEGPPGTRLGTTGLGDILKNVQRALSIMRTGFGKTAFCLKSNFNLSPRPYFHACGLVMDSRAFGLGLKAKSGLEYTVSVSRPVLILTYDPLFHSLLLTLIQLTQVSA